MNKKRCGHASFTQTFDTQELPKFKKDTLATLQLIKSYNPTFVTTFIVSHRQAQYLTGDDLRRYENMITLKKKKEINAKYTGLLKSKVKGESSDITCNKKSSVRVASTKPKRLTSSKMESKKKSDSRNDKPDMAKIEISKNDCKKTSDMKEIFKSNVFSNFSTTSSFNDLVKASADHFPSPMDLIEKTGGKLKTFWNLEKSIEGVTSVKKKNEDNEASVNNYKIDEKSKNETHLNLEVDSENCLQLDPENNLTISHAKVPEPRLDGGVNNVVLLSYSRTHRRGSKTIIKSMNTQTNVLKVTKNLLKRNCFSLLNIYSSNTCRFSYKNCVYCNGRNNYPNVTSSNKLSGFKSTHGNEKIDEVAEERSTVEKQSCSVRFIAIQFTNYKLEMAQSECILEQKFTFDEHNESYIIGLRRSIGHLIRSMVDFTPKEIASSENSGKVKLVNDSTLLLDVKHKIVLVAFGMALCSWAIYLSISNFVSSSEIN